MCRHKRYSKMIMECDLLHPFLYKDKVPNSEDRKPEFNKNILKVDKYVNSTVWELGYHKGVIGIRVKGMK